MTIFCATGNAGKLREFKLAGDVLGINIEPVPGLESLAAPEETGATFEENACLKALYYSRYAPGLVFADDSGLSADALDGEPGVYSARFAGEGAGDAANNALLLRRLEGMPNRSARFICVIALAEQGIVKATFRGEVAGLIIDPLTEQAKGTGGFGYDPLFRFAPFGATFAEVDEVRKFGVSHRGNAMRKMLEYLK